MKEAVLYFLSFKSYVVLPVIIFILSMVFRIKLSVAIKSALTIGIGFVGIFMTFDYFVMVISPVVQALIERTGLHYNVLDAGWPPLAAIAWAFPLAPALLVIFMVTNVLLLVLKLTKTVNIDIWNYWHVILAGAMVFQVTHNPVITIFMSIIIFIILLKLSEWSAPMVNDMMDMEGICIPHLAGAAYFPFALIGNKLMNQIPRFNNINANPDVLKKKLGFFGEPMLLGLILGAGLSIGAGYNLRSITEIAINFAAVIYILPIMCGILGGALIPVSEGMKIFIRKTFPSMGETYMGLDVAVLFGSPSIVVTALLLIPVALLLAFLLPGINFIPLGDLTALMVPLAFICLATNGNIIRSFILGIPVIIASLYVASGFASFYTKMAADSGYQMAEYTGTFTSFLDGGNFFRAWMVGIASMNPVSLMLIPFGVILMFVTWKMTRKA
ncbi:MAG: PTS galactitol transporter subunit IIC [Firmicutes bacterium HGW-Firmicutes-1]|jgi:PTS system galactitol-specific IIC component|nr:MAG: PTS galactitol transporter subunit IIC [Firmicutes bacterium HGW-Firmicutes-1]